LVSGIVATGEVRPADRFWVLRYSLWRMLCYYCLVGCDV